MLPNVSGVVCVHVCVCMLCLHVISAVCVSMCTYIDAGRGGVEFLPGNGQFCW